MESNLINVTSNLTKKLKNQSFISLKRIGNVGALSISPFSRLESLRSLKQENEIEQE